MKVLMLGWEFPPYKSGGLGTACYDLSKGLTSQGVQVIFVMPFAPKDAQEQFVKLVGANTIVDSVTIRSVPSLLSPYMRPEDYEQTYKLNGSGDLYGPNMAAELARYEQAVEKIVADEDFDVIHAHDWMTYKAALRARDLSNKPLVVHLHATESDRTAGNPNLWIAQQEYLGLNFADRVIANSNWTKQNIVKEYAISSEKIDVVHWGISQENPDYALNYTSPLNKKDKIVLSLGRVTVQKGIDYLVRAARLVVNHVPNVKFVIAGKGDKLPEIVRLVSDLDLSNKFIFTGWLAGSDVHRAFQMADVFVMPSVSEPFGLVALESLKNGTPIIISKQSGASEVVANALKVDFWNVSELANKLIALLNYPVLHQTLREHSHAESSTFDLETPARKCINIYKNVLEAQ